MINKIIYFIKKTPFLYRLAKRVNRRLRTSSAVPKPNKIVTYYGYILTDENQLPQFIEEYSKLAKYNTKLLILVDNASYNINMHRFIRENPDICFTSFDYYKKYHNKLSFYRVVWLNYTDANKELLDYLA